MSEHEYTNGPVTIRQEMREAVQAMDLVQTKLVHLTCHVRDNDQHRRRAERWGFNVARELNVMVTQFARLKATLDALSQLGPERQEQRDRQQTFA